MKTSSSVFLFIALLVGVVSNVIAQQSVSFSAFTTCIDEDGNAGLCSQESWYLAEGYSALDQDSAAALSTSALAGISGTDLCSRTSLPASIISNLLNPNLEIGDTIKFTDIIIEAFDINSNFMSEIPVRIDVISQPDMLTVNPEQELIEITSFGHAQFFVTYYCDATIANSDGFALTVNP